MSRRRVEFSAYTGEIVAGGKPGEISMATLAHRAYENQHREHANKLGYARGFRDGFNTSPISVTPVDEMLRRTGPEQFYASQFDAMNRIYHQPFLVPNIKGTDVPKQPKTLVGEIFQKGDWTQGRRMITNEGKVHPITGAAVTERYVVRQSLGRTDGAFRL